MTLVSPNIGNNGKGYIPYDDGSKTTGSQQEAGKAAQQEDVFNPVLLPTEVLELQGKHGNLAYQ